MLWYCRWHCCCWIFGSHALTWVIVHWFVMKFWHMITCYLWGSYNFKWGSSLLVQKKGPKLKRWKIGVFIKIDVKCLFFIQFFYTAYSARLLIEQLRVFDGTLTQPTHTMLNGTLPLWCGIPKVNEGRNFIHDCVFANSCLCCSLAGRLI